MDGISFVMQPKHEETILILVPANNEAARIGPVITAAKQFLPLLVVDDGSRDETASLVEQLGVNVYRQIPNQGKGAALRSGFKLALEKGYQAVITMDADGQHDPQEIPGFLDTYFKTRADLIIGSRDFSKMPFTRKLANMLGGIAFSWAVRHPVRDNQSGYRLISRRLMEKMLESTESGFEFEVEMVVVCLKNQFRLDWVPIQTIYMDQGSHIQPLAHLWHFIRIIIKTRKQTAP
jgi:glycosyltransferase involved in cell wall biosynthesis